MRNHLEALRELIYDVRVQLTAARYTEDLAWDVMKSTLSDETKEVARQASRKVGALQQDIEVLGTALKLEAPSDGSTQTTEQE